LKGVLYSVRRIHYITLGGMTLPDQGVGSHEEAFFFDCFLTLLLVCWMCDVHPKMRRVMWVLLPFVLMGDLACNRRAATAAFIVVIPMLLLAAHRALPSRRRLVVAIALAMVAGVSIYYPIFKDRYGMFAQPARAIRSQFDPDPRDKSSNDYRVAEEGDLYATIKADPLAGYGYGKRMLHAVPIADISRAYPWWDIMTHNQILWVWMRVGTVGFLAFWMMISAIVVGASRLLRAEGASAEHKAAAMFGLLVISALLVFGLLDLQLSNFRDMLFAGFWAGIVAALPSLSSVKRRPVEASFGRRS
ncbi:MAG: O-antigen ligase family protein, partial [Polyangiales bacterium]